MDGRVSPSLVIRPHIHLLRETFQPLHHHLQRKHHLANPLNECECARAKIEHQRLCSLLHLLDLLDLREFPAEWEGPLSEVWEEVKTSCSSPHPLFTMDGVSAGAVDVEPVAVDVDDLLDD